MKIEQLEDLPLAHFDRLPEETSSVGKDKFNKWEVCKLKITTIVVFVIMIQRIFPSKELAPMHSTIVDSFIFIHKWSRVFNSTSHSFAALTRELSSQTLEEKFPMNARPCIILYESIYNGTIEGLYDMVNA